MDKNWQEKLDDSYRTTVLWGNSGATKGGAGRWGESDGATGSGENRPPA